MMVEICDDSYSTHHSDIYVYRKCIYTHRFSYNLVEAHCFGKGMAGQFLSKHVAVAASGSCMPSAADEGWHSPKRPYSTVAVNSSRVCTEVSCPFFCHVAVKQVESKTF